MDRSVIKGLEVGEGGEISGAGGEVAGKIEERDLENFDSKTIGQKGLVDIRGGVFDEYCRQHLIQVSSFGPARRRSA